MTAKHVDVSLVLPPERQQAVAIRHEMTVEELIGQVAKIQQVMQAVMKKDEHYGVIPGTTPKPTLLKAGAEKLCLLFRLDPQYESFESWDGAHLTVKSRCTLYHIPTGERRGSGEGSCSTKESKYAYRQGKRACPACGVETIFKSKHAPRNKPNAKPGWFCWAAKGGCGAEFAPDDKGILEQNTDRVPNPDLPDQYNTVLKMANKRSLIAASLNVTAASDIFTQDLEDLPKTARQEEAMSDEELSQPAERPAARAPRARAAEKRAPAREEPPPSEPEAGFDEDGPIGKEQQREIWDAVRARAGQLAMDPTQLLGQALRKVGKEKSADLLMSGLVPFLNLIEFFPGEGEEIPQ